MTLIKGSNVSQGIKAIRGISFQTMATGTLSATTPQPGRIGDILISTTTGKMYVASAIAGASADWNLVTIA